MREIYVLGLLVLGGVAASGTLQATESLARMSQTASGQYDELRVVLPRGEASAGRQAFLDLRCTACHQVAGEATFPTPVSASEGPLLDHRLGSRQAGDRTTAIIAPSHSMSTNVSAELRQRLSGVLSPMGDYTQVMTVRQLLDLVAYLDGLEP